jgi:hypothetical protein
MINNKGVTMKKLIQVVLIIIVSTSLSFSQWSEGTKLIDGELNYFKPTDGDALTMLELTYGQFFTENVLAGVSMSFSSFDGESSTDFALYGNYFYNQGLYLGAGFSLPDEGESEAMVQWGSLMSFKESSNVYLNPGIRYYIDSEVFQAGVGLTLLF